MKKLKIAHQLFALIGVLMAAFAVATYFEIRTSEQAIYDERFDMLRTQVESGISVLNTFYEREKAGQMTHEAAQAEAFDVLKRVTFQPSGYLFGFDYNVVLLFHPSPVNVGKDMSGQIDKTGAKFSQALVDRGKAGGGRTLYYWSKPGQPEDQLFLKGGYSKAFEPWKIVVGTGVYLDDLQQKVNATIWKALTASLIVFVCGIGAAAYFIRGISSPLKDVHNALQAVAEFQFGGVARPVGKADQKGAIGEIGIDFVILERLQTVFMRREIDDTGLWDVGADGLAQCRARCRAGAHADRTPGRRLQVNSADGSLVEKENLQVIRRILAQQRAGTRQEDGLGEIDAFAPGKIDRGRTAKKIDLAILHRVKTIGQRCFDIAFLETGHAPADFVGNAPAEIDRIAGRAAIRRLEGEGLLVGDIAKADGLALVDRVERLRIGRPVGWKTESKT